MIGTWSLSWPVRCHLPPSTHLLLLVHLHRLPSWSRRPRRGATSALRTDASGVSAMGHDPSCSSWNVGWSSHFRSSMGHRERHSGHWSGAGEWQVEDRMITARGGKIILQDEVCGLVIASYKQLRWCWVMGVIPDTCTCVLIMLALLHSGTGLLHLCSMGE